MIDGMKNAIDYDLLNTKKIEQLCDRHFGIGADGLIVLSPSQKNDFKMVYFNADGRESTMCGNGSRCLISFANQLGYIGKTCVFEAIDGLHLGRVEDNISVKMIDVEQVKNYENDFVINTGSPHYVRFVESLEGIDFINEAKAIRHSDNFNEEGINVNFVQITDSGIAMRTFERGVEDETLSCGTGVVAASIASSYDLIGTSGLVNVSTLGGMLNVSFKREKNVFTDVWLTGPATKVFTGELEI